MLNGAQRKGKKEKAHASVLFIEASISFYPYFVNCSKRLTDGLDSRIRYSYG